MVKVVRNSRSLIEIPPQCKKIITVKVKVVQNLIIRLGSENKTKIILKYRNIEYTGNNYIIGRFVNLVKEMMEFKEKRAIMNRGRLEEQEMFL